MSNTGVLLVHVHRMNVYFVYSVADSKQLFWLLFFYAISAKRVGIKFGGCFI